MSTSALALQIVTEYTGGSNKSLRCFGYERGKARTKSSLVSKCVDHQVLFRFGRGLFFVGGSAMMTMVKDARYLSYVGEKT